MRPIGVILFEYFCAYFDSPPTAFERRRTELIRMQSCHPANLAVMSREHGLQWNLSTQVAAGAIGLPQPKEAENCEPSFFVRKACMTTERRVSQSSILDRQRR